MDRSGEGLGVARQREDGVKLIERKGWTLAEQYVDNDVSASSVKPRPEYQRMLADIRAGAIDAVVVWSLDRLTRRTIEIEEFIELADDHGIALASVGGDVDIATASGRLHCRIMAAVARDEVDRKSDRQRRQRLQAAESGIQNGGPRAFGYTANGLHLEPDEASLLATAYRRFIGGESLGSIARWLNGLGVTTPRGARWRYQSVREVLANPRNAGLRGMRQPLPGRAGRAGRREQWHTIIGDAQWEGVVDRDTWERVVTVLKDPARGELHVGNQQRYLLSGIAECGVCGTALITGRREGVRLLRCPSLRHVSRKAEPVERLVLAHLLSAVSDPDALRVLARRKAEGDDPDLATMRDRVEVLRSRKRGLLAAVADPDMDFDWDDVRHKAAEIDEALRDLDRRFAEATRTDRSVELIDAPDPAQVWDSWPLQTRRGVLASWLRVEVLPGTPGRRPFDPASVRITWTTT